ncbi:MAG: TIGR04255 family protein [Methanosarcina vacuolata]|jgi:uncharacterized protein (TIGR04255 family)|nr:TIGR04255 family protein [Methanosarcina vacuolata]
MEINEIFPNPTVKQVIFQIRYPNLFFIENKIGDFQIKIMKYFPESSFFIKRNMLVVDAGDDQKIEELSKQIGIEPSKKVWQFKAKNGTVLNVMSNSLDISSGSHKTYTLGNGETFKSVIKLVVDSFLEITAVPVLERIGLRYIDECPLPSKDNETFESYYNSVISTHRFDLETVELMDFRTTVSRNGKSLNYGERLIQKDEQYKLILDFDGFATNIDSDTYLNVTDELHDIILKEYGNTIKEPVIEYMRRSGGN